MTTKSFSSIPDSSSDAPSSDMSSFTRLRGIWLILARMLWVALAAVALGLFISGIPLRIDNLREQYQPTLGLNLGRNRAGEIVLSPWLPQLSSGQQYPALQAGLLEGDVLVVVNGVPVRVEQDQPLTELLPSGPAGTPVRLAVRTGDQPVREYTLFLGGTDPIALAQWGLPVEFIITYAVAVEIVFALLCFGIAAVIFMRRSNDWLALLASLTFIFILVGLSAHIIAVYSDQPLWRPTLDVWFALVLFSLLVFFCLFPDGRFVPRWTLAVVLVGIVWMLVQWLDPRLYPWKMRAVQLGFTIIAAWLSVGVIAQIYRYRRHSNLTQRHQTKWVVFGTLAATLGLLGQIAPVAWPVPAGFPSLFYDVVGYPITQLLKLFLPVTIAIAILRYRLWDIDILLNRTLVYATLTAIVVGIYVIVVGTLGTTIQGRAGLFTSILTTGLVAVLVQPLRDRLQRGVNRMMYGERDDPVTVLSRLGQRLEGTLAPKAVLPSLVETIAQTLKLPYVAIEPATHPGHESLRTIAYGQPQADVIRLPLIYQSETIGQLLVAPRAPGEALSPLDRHLLENIAHQAGMAVHAVSLTEDLQHSRQRLVAAREEERRRLRRDLHDGLGPNLASQGLKLAAVKQLLENDPASATPLLDQIMAQNQATVDDVRRLVYGLRPPALDELGLVAAIRDYVTGMDSNATLQVEITEPAEGLPPLSAATEVAAYRIVLEALTNVIRHAQAQHCLIRFTPQQTGANSNGLLQIEIQDDGVGLPSTQRVHTGIGTHSMRERAEEVGGTCVIINGQPSGVKVLAQLPIG